MCRIIAIFGKTKYVETISILEKFRQLAENGKIPKGTSRGHKDGWGIAAYENDQIYFCIKNFKDAYYDRRYAKVFASLKNRKVNALIGHLRKASVGERSILNCQPFVFDDYSFCQNGTIFESSGISLNPKFEKKIKGTTDSERFFMRIIQEIDNLQEKNNLAIKKAIRKTMIQIKSNFDYTAMNMVFSDGKRIWAAREINEKNKNVKEELTNYYSLFFGTNGNLNIISSEKISFKGVKWKMIKNHSFVEYKI